jgi:malic enzyme
MFLQLLGKNPESVKVVILGAGAAGTACAKIIKQLKVNSIIAGDRKGSIIKNVTTSMSLSNGLPSWRAERKFERSHCRI